MCRVQRRYAPKTAQSMRRRSTPIRLSRMWRMTPASWHGPLLLIVAVLLALASVSEVFANGGGNNATHTAPIGPPPQELRQPFRPSYVGIPAVNQPLTPQELDSLVDAVVNDNITATSAFLTVKPPYDSNGAPVLMIMTVRVYTELAQNHMRDYLKAHMQGMQAVMPQSGLVATYRFVNHVSSFKGAMASPAHAGIARKFNLTELSAFDFTYTFGAPPGERFIDPFSVSYLNIIMQTVVSYVTQAGFHSKAEFYPLIGMDYPSNFCNAEPVFFDQRASFKIRLSGPDLIPFIVERQTATILAFRDTFIVQNTTMRTQNVTSFSVVPKPSNRRSLLGRPVMDEVDIVLQCVMTPVDWFTPRQAMQAVLKNGVFEATAAKIGVPMSARLLDASMVTTKTMADGTIEKKLSDVDEVSGFNTPAGGPAAALRRGAFSATASAVAGRWSFADWRGKSRSWTSLLFGDDGAGGLKRSLGVVILIAASLVTAGGIVGALLAAERGGLLGGATGSSSGRVFPGLESLRDGKRMSPQWSTPESSSGQFTPQATGTLGDLSAFFRSSDSLPGSDEETEALGRSSSEGRRVQKEMEPQAKGALEVGEEVALCTDADGRPVVLGRGSWGHIYLATRWGTQEVAVKVIDREGHDSSWLGLLRREVAMLRRISFDRNIVQFYGACLEGDHAMLIMEYCAGGDLRRALQSERGPELAWYRGGRAVALDVARGLRFCHATGVIHRDLKSSNVLLTAEGVAKIGDVGLARLAGAAGETSSIAVAGTFSFAAPEMLMGKKVTEKADSYSFGVLLWEIATHEVPLRGQMRELHCPQEAPDELADLIEACMDVDPDLRPSSQQIFEALQAMVHLECDGRAERLTSPEKQAAGGTCQHASSNPPAGRPA
mmetsp:Transcript_12482/g.37497  ORF Transcript_12482/g.37497 Transcript_12482/m.37497 type:complete len:888 (-) Transcript_12482:561-3224(-)